MTKEEYLQKKQGLYDEYKKKLSILQRDCAYKNKKYKIGDIVEDHYHIIRIEKIEFCLNFESFPKCKYLGTCLTEKLQLKKDQRHNTCYESNIKRKLN